MANKESRTLWVGDVEGWMDEEFLHRVFSSAGFVTNIKIIQRRGVTSAPGFAFVEFNDPKVAATIVGDKAKFSALGFSFRVNFAQFSVGENAGRSKFEHSIYVGNLDCGVRDLDLYRTFAERFSSVSSAKVIMDTTTQISRGFGFVRFREQEDADAAIREMEGIFLGSKAMKVRASHQKPPEMQTADVREKPWTPSLAPVGAAGLPVVPAPNAVICIGALETASAQDLQQLLQRCSAFGAILRHCFAESSLMVEYYDPTAAEAAAAYMSGLCGLMVNFIDAATIEYFCTLQLEGWQRPGFEVAVSNLTSKAGVQPGSHEHFKALLQDANFVRLFQELLRSQGKSAGVEDLWSMLLQDKPDLFYRPMHEVVHAANADVAKAFGGTRMASGLVSLPDHMRLGL